MGYTHYWSGCSPAPTDLVNLMEDARKIVEAAQAQGVVICGGMGEGKPEIGERQIWLNGDASQSLDHETFMFPTSSWAFCKTARKPYDLVVCSILLLAKYHLGDAVRISSDGDREDDEWGAAEAFVKSILGYDLQYERESTT